MRRFTAVKLGLAVASCLAIGAARCAAAGEIQFTAVHGVNQEGLNNWFDKTKADGYRPQFLTGYNINSQILFAGVAVKDGKDLAWEAREGQPGPEFQKTFDDLVKQGYRVVCLGGYPQQQETRFTSLWVKDDDKDQWTSRIGLSSEEYQQKFDEQKRNGLRPVQVVGYPTGNGSYALGAVFVEARDVVWIAKHDQTEEQLQGAFEQYDRDGYRAISLSGYETGEGPRFALVMVKDNLTWRAKYGLTADEYQNAFAAAADEGYRPVSISGYVKDGDLRYAAVWVKD
jgi:hypothetical protein